MNAALQEYTRNLLQSQRVDAHFWPHLRQCVPDICSSILKHALEHASNVCAMRLVCKEWNHQVAVLYEWPITMLQHWTNTAQKSASNTLFRFLRHYVLDTIMEENDMFIRNISLEYTSLGLKLCLAAMTCNSATRRGRFLTRPFPEGCTKWTMIYFSKQTDANLDDMFKYAKSWCDEHVKNTSQFEEALILSAVRRSGETWSQFNWVVENLTKFGLEDSRGTLFAQRCLIRICEWPISHMNAAWECFTTKDQAERILTRDFILKIIDLLKNRQCNAFWKTLYLLVCDGNMKDFSWLYAEPNCAAFFAESKNRDLYWNLSTKDKRIVFELLISDGSLQTLFCLLECTPLEEMSEKMINIIIPGFKDHYLMPHVQSILGLDEPRPEEITFRGIAERYSLKKQKLE